MNFFLDFRDDTIPEKPADLPFPPKHNRIFEPCLRAAVVASPINSFLGNLSLAVILPLDVISKENKIIWLTCRDTTSQFTASYLHSGKYPKILNEEASSADTEMASKLFNKNIKRARMLLLLWKKAKKFSKTRN